ncbi:flagellar protein FliT [Candidatus Sodalis endolongispinus]|uniref:Flagellar protein FliT n=1 Tax=Candidatus Sodalis endolongispinus TaxID=2812662 RepID=A0ABS5Y7U5_9GAMM|nr:flagellar protein FliT [Candidatus Sodalis endolongispinus]MBT9431013.1 flagellar protein FliT [Candidatus Sodalis endolongispinus]
MLDAFASLLSYYQQVGSLSELMLEMAQQGQWELLIDQEKKYVFAVAKIAEHTGAMTAVLSDHQQQCIARVFQQLIKNEEEVKRLMQQRLSELHGMISVSSKQHTLNAAYSKFSDSASILPGDIK